MFNEPDEESSRVNSLSSRKETVKEERERERRVILQRIPLDFGIKFLDLKSFDLKEMEERKETKLDE